MRQSLTAIAVLALASACASPGLPPGGPTLSSFPRVIATLPDSSAVNVRPGKVLVRYDDVIGEQVGGQPLSRIVLLSPWDGEPKVEWRRTGMTIAPRKGWRTNTAYTITILPGVNDLKGTPSPYGYVLRFSTGATIPQAVLRGVAFDWVANRALPRATIQAISTTDTTLVHVTVADSTGRYELGTLPPGSYLVRAIDEKTPNRTLDLREAWDTATVTLTDSVRTDLYVFVHDTIAPRISDLRQADSVTIGLTFDKPLRPGVPIPVTAVRVVKADSSVVEIESVMTLAEERVQQARADSIRLAADTTTRRPGAEPPAARRTIDPTRRRDTVVTVPPPEPERAPPATELVVKLRAPLQPATTYRVTVSGVRNLLDREGTSTRLLIVPRPAPPDSTRRPPAAAGDSTARPPATPARPDSTRRPPRAFRR
ncbi:MAG: Ig-like domain-containing protein [Gemmatimonadota bacterium]